MDLTVQEIIERFEMEAHPEGGFYKEIYRSELNVPGKDRQMATSIYFLLRSQDVSHFHRIQSDELWFYHAGSPLTVHVLDENGHQKLYLGNDLAKGQTPQALVPAKKIFGSSVDLPDSYSLVSCVCAPGFDYQDFELFSYDELIRQFPAHNEIIERLTIKEK